MSCGTGGPGRNSFWEAKTQGFQVAAIGRIGFVPVHLPRPTGTEPVHLASVPSDLPRAMTRAATSLPRAKPAVTSLG